MAQGNKSKIDPDYVDWQTSVRLQKHRIEPERPSQADVAADNLETLYSEDGEAFIQLAFKSFLDRPPTDPELREFTGDLDAGIGKSILAARIRYLPEASQREQKLNLRSAWLLDKLGNIPVLGPCTHLLIALLSGPAIKRSLSSHQQTIGDLRRQIDQLKTYSQGVNKSVLDDIVCAEERHKLDNEALTEELHREVQSLRDRQRELDDKLEALETASGATGSKDLIPPIDDSFYIAFENHFRGSEEDIRQRLTYYLPVLKAKLSAANQGGAVADIGCGRGEWIDLLRDNGFSATGVDMNEKNIDLCAEKKLNVVRADGISWLRNTTSQSLTVISAFHLIEHLTLPQLNSLLIESLRCLKPGGLIVLETPNPENLITAANRFYTDPSHRHPLPPDLMEFILKFHRYEDIEIHRLHPAADKLDDTTAVAEKLNDLLFGPQDYAVIARKP